MRPLRERLLPTMLPTPGRPGVLFRWVRPVVERGRLWLDDLWLMPEGCDVRWADSALQRELQARAEAPLLAVLCACFWRQMLPATLCKLAADLLRYLPPLLISALLQLADAQQELPEWPSVVWAYTLAVMLPVCTLSQAVLVNQYFWHALRLGALARAALAAAICRRALRYRLSEQVDSGLLTNLLSSDCGRVSTACGSINMLWSAPLQLTIALGMLWRALGPAVLGGITVMLLLMPVQAWISQALAGLRARTASATDRRLRQTGAVMEARQAVKLQRWEGLCAAEVAGARRAEVSALRREAAVKAVSVLLVTVAPTMVSLATFTALALSGQPLQAAPVFSALVLFNAMRSPLSALPDLFTSLAHARVALVRIQRVLRDGGRQGPPAPPWPCPPPAQPSQWRLTRRSNSAHGCSDSDAETSSEDDEEEAGPWFRDPLIMVCNATFSWQNDAGACSGGCRTPTCASGACSPSTKSLRSPLPRSRAASMPCITNGVWARPPKEPNDSLPNGPALSFTGVDSYSGAAVSDDQARPPRKQQGIEPALQDVSFCVQRGQLLAVLGGMGSGKSTLIAALLGELHHVSGEVFCSHSVSYSGQNVHITRGTVRENILFGRPLDPRRYQAALDACALRADVASWPEGEATELGERGTAISGGQQARVALARAVYGKPDVCLLDEPLASLDPQTCSHVWSGALRGLLRRSAVVVSTTSAQLAMAADLVLVLEAGNVVQYGPPSALAAAAGPLSELLAEGGAAAEAPELPGCSPRPRSTPGMRPLSSGHLRSSEPGIFGSGNLYPVDVSSPESRALYASGSSPTLLKLDTPSSVVMEAMPETAARQVDKAWRTAEGRGRRAKADSYCTYAAQFGGRGSVFALSLGMFAAAQGSIVLADCWLARWSSLAPDLQNDLVTNLGGLALLATLAAGLVAMQASAWPLLCLRASSGMHAKGLDRALRAPLSCSLMATPGQMMSRFSRDLDTVDSRLPGMLSQTLTCIAALSCSVVTIVVSSPQTAPAAALLGLSFARLVVSYRPIASEATRLISVLHGPVVAQLLESLGGREYLRAFVQIDVVWQSTNGTPDLHMSLIVKVLILSALTACGLASRPPSGVDAGSDSGGDVIPSELELRSQQGSTTNTSRKNINICCLEKHEKKDANGRKRAHFTVEAYDHKVGPREGLTERCSLTALAEWSLMTHRQQKKECQRRFWNSKQYYRLTAGDDEDELKDLNGKKAATQATMSNCKKKLEDKYNMTVGSAKETLQKAKQAHEDGLSSTLDLQAKDNKRLEELKKQIQALEEKMATYAVQIVQLEEKFNQSRNDFDREKQRALDEYTASQTGADAEFDTKMARFTESTKAIEQRKAERMKHVGNVTDAKMPQTCQENDALGCCCSVVVGPSYAVAVMVDKTFIDWTRCIKPRKYTWNSAKYPKTCEAWGKCPECQELVCGAHKCPAAEEPEAEEGDEDDYQ